MKQVNKFYLASFLKNQTYFVPILVIFFQDLGLDYSQIFWIFTLGSVFSFVIEIPTGIFADLIGKRQSIIWSKLIIFISFVLFGLASSFWWLMLANLVYELGKSFRSGTETAYTYDYLSENKNKPTYTKVKASQKFYARLSESIGAAIGGLLAVRFGFNMVFFIAAIPAFINFVQTLTWVKITENNDHYNVKKTFDFAKKSIAQIFSQSILRKIVFNIMIFSSVFFAMDKFIQPYMSASGIELQYFGWIYSGFLLIVAFLVRYASKLEEAYGGVKVVNFLTGLAVVPLLILGLGYQSIFGVILFFIVMMIENLRSPIANSVFHDNVNSKNRATMGSLLELFKTSVKLILLPLAGYLADFYSISIVILIFAFVVLVNAILFKFSQRKPVVDNI